MIFPPEVWTRTEGAGGPQARTRPSSRGNIRAPPLIVSGYDIGTADGGNEKGLVVSLPAFVETDFGTLATVGRVIWITAWVIGYRSHRAASTSGRISSASAS